MGLLKILEGKVKIPVDIDSDDESYSYKELEKRRGNDEVYADLLLSINYTNCFIIIKLRKTNDLKEGDEALYCTKLCDKYDSKIRASKIKLKMDFHQKNTKWEVKYRYLVNNNGELSLEIGDDT